MPPLNEIAELIHSSKKILITAHERPDGDAIGSMAGLGFILKELDKEIKLVNISGIPDRFAWLKLPEPIYENLDGYSPDLIFVLDCGEFSRVGKKMAQELGKDQFNRTVNIDHHLGNPKFGLLNWVDPKMSSVGEMIGMLAKHLQAPLSSAAVEALYLALSSDTGNFSYSNTRPSTMNLAAELLKLGLDLDAFNCKMQRQWSLNKLFLHGTAMKNTILHSQGKIGVIKVTQKMLRENQATLEDCEDLVNYVRSISSVQVAVSLREEAGKEVKFSLRSWGEVDVSKIARKAGGGGHHNAAGGAIYDSLSNAEAYLVQTISQFL